MYPISNFLIKIKNAKLAGKKDVSTNYSKLIENILKVLKKEGYIANYKIYKEGHFKYIKVNITDANISDLKIISSPGKRIYYNVNALKKLRNTVGVTVVSTPKGVVSHKEALKNNVGGEVICRVW